jgi:CBS domain-containing protein
MIAADIMTENPLTIRQTDTIGDAIDALQSMDIRHLPVVDDEGNLVGMLSDRDLGPLMRTFTEGADAERMIVPLSRRRVTDFMSSDVVSVDVDAEVSSIIETMLEQHVGAVPVVDGEGAVSGIISYVDLLRALGSPTEERAFGRTKPKAESSM